jgi:hypothetical protein
MFFPVNLYFLKSILNLDLEMYQWLQMEANPEKNNVKANSEKNLKFGQRRDHGSEHTK